MAKAIPPNSGLRLKTAEIVPGQIRLDGEAQQQPPIITFGINLAKSSYGLADYKWETPPPQNSNKGWEFRYNGTLPE